MRIIEMPIYTIQELSEKAKEKAFNDFCNTDLFPFGSDNEKTLTEFVKIFPVKVNKFSYGNGNYFIDFEFTGDLKIENLKGIRLLAYLQNNYFSSLFTGKWYYGEKYWANVTPKNKDSRLKYKRQSKVLFSDCCTLTGYYIDQDILSPVYDFIKNPLEKTTFYDLMRRCLKKWITACNTSYEDYFVMDNFLDMSESNDWEYTEEGDLYA